MLHFLAMQFLNQEPKGVVFRSLRLLEQSRSTLAQGSKGEVFDPVLQVDIDDVVDHRGVLSTPPLLALGLQGGLSALVDSLLLVLLLGGALGPLFVHGFVENRKQVGEAFVRARQGEKVVFLSGNGANQFFLCGLALVLHEGVFQDLLD